MSAALFKKAKLKVLTAAILGMFAGGAVPGVFLDANDWGPTGTNGTGVVYTDTTTPVTTMELPVQFILDKSQGLARSSEIITNAADRNFTSNTGYWTLDTGIAIGGNACNWTGQVAGAGFYKPSMAVAGNYYEITYTIGALSAGGIRSVVSGSGVGATRTAPGTYTDRIFCTANTYIGVLAASNGTVGTVTSVSIKRILGNHAWVGGSPNRPVITARYNQIIDSQNMANWAAGGATGATSGLITAVAGAGGHYIRRNTGSSWVLAGMSVTMRFVVKQGSTRYATVGDLGDTPYHNCTIDFNTGTISNTVGGTATISAQQADGSYIVYLTYTRTTGGLTVAPFVGANTASSTASLPSFTAAGTETVYCLSVDVRPSDQFVYLPQYQWVTTGGAGGYDASPLFPPIIKGNGTNQYLTGNMDLSGTNKVTAWAGVRKFSDAASAPIFETSVNADANNGTIELFNPTSSGAPNVGFYSRGTAQQGAIKAAFPAPVTSVLTGIADISAPVVTLRINGVQAATSAGSQGTGNFGNYPYYLLSRAGSSAFSTAGFNTIIVAGKQASNSEIILGEQFANLKIKAA